MFDKSKKSSSTHGNFNLNVLGEGTIIEGNLNSKGDIRIDGNVKGNIVTDSKFVLGENGKVEGEIKAKNCDISGEVKGNVSTTELLIIKSNGIIHGDIVTDKLVVESGGKFNGKCQMGQIAKMNIPSTGETQIFATVKAANE